MTLDIKLIRDILLTVSNEKTEIEDADLVQRCKAQGYIEVKEHIGFLSEKGMITCRIIPCFGQQDMQRFVTGITADGSDFLASVKDEKIFNRFLEVSKKFQCVSLDVAKHVCNAIAQAEMLKSLGI